MKKITLLALMAGAIISINSPAGAQGIYLDLAVMDLVAIAMMADATGTTTARVTGTGIATAIVEEGRILSPQHRAI